MSKKLWLGIGMMILSYAQWLLPKQLFVDHHFLAGCFLTIFVTMFYLGIILVCGAITKKFGGPSMFKTALSSRKNFVLFVLGAGVAGVLLDTFAQWLGKLWIYPYFFTWLYWLIVFPGFVFYWVTIVKSYMAVKALLDSRYKTAAQRPDVPRSRRYERGLFPLLGAAGACMIGVAVYEMLLGYHAHGGYVFEVVHRVDYAPAFVWPFVGLGGVFFVAEWLLYVRGAPSFLRSVMRGYWVPLVAILIASVLLSFIMETQNVMHGHWVYTHWPSPEATLAGVQDSVWLAWPLHYLLFLSVPGVFASVWATIFFGRHQVARKK